MKRFTENEIRGILEEAEAPGGFEHACRKYNVSEVTLHRWRERYGRGPDTGDAAALDRIAQLEAENTRLKRLLSKQAMDLAMLRGALGRRAL